MAGADTSREDDALDDAKEAFETADEAWRDNYDAALDDWKFGRLHEHWPEAIRKQREEDGRPCLTIPLLPPIFRQVINDARQNKPAISVHPVDDGADPHTAEVFNGLIRHIERSSDADVAYDTALEAAVIGGFGWFKLNTRYATDDGFDQDLVIEPVPNCFSIRPDPNSTAADSSDWNSAFELDALPKRAFEKRWPDADAVSFQGRGNAAKPAEDGEQVQFVVRWMREEATRSIVALSAPGLDIDPQVAMQAMGVVGNTADPDLSLVYDLKVYEANKELFDALGMTIIGQPRAVPSFKVRRCTYSGADELESADWAGKFIPIVPVYGEDFNIEGRRYVCGLVRPAKDEQRRHNFFTSSATEATALAPKTPFIGKKGQFVSDAAKWATANTQTWAYIEYDSPHGEPAPERQPYAGVPIGDFQMAAQASESIKAITGIHNASLGAPSNETSGRAIMARQREGDTGTFHYVDNLSRAIRHAGRIALDLIPSVYSTKRIIRIIGPENQQASVQIGKPAPDAPPAQAQAPSPFKPSGSPGGAEAQAEEIAHVYDLTAGKYDLTVSSGPSFTSRREEAATQMIELIQAYPAVAPVIGDLLAKNLDWPGADEIAERMRALLPAQLQGENPESMALKAQMQKLVEILGQAKAKITDLETDKANDSRKLDIDAANAETNRLKALLGKDGGPYDPAQMAMVATQSLVHIMQSPDILQAMDGGATPEQIGQLVAQRMAPQQADPGAQPPMAA